MLQQLPIYRRINTPKEQVSRRHVCNETIWIYADREAHILARPRSAAPATLRTADPPTTQTPSGILSSCMQYQLFD
jgi:hypothetical protein